MIAAVLLLALTAAAPAEVCGLCHPGERVEWAQSVHASERVACHDCHGGDPAASSVEGAHRGSFSGVPRRSDIPASCAACHADIARMRPYNLPADQYALYQLSVHGMRLAQGDESVAVCTDCHGVHEVRRRDDPLSPVFPTNIPATCAHCHGSSDGKGGPSPGGDAYSDYVASVHGKAFLERGNPSAPQCASCHGAHGAAPPGVGDVDKVCGQCHASARTYFLRGPHAAGMAGAEHSECASCHSHHRIEPAGGALLETVCLDCHGAGSPEEETAVTIKTLFGTASDAIDSARQLVDRAEAVPLYVEDYRARLEEARTSLVQSFPVMHALDVERIQQMTNRARSIAHEVQSEVNGKLQERTWRRVGLALFWFYLLLTIAVLVRYRRRAVVEASG